MISGKQAMAFLVGMTILVIAAQQLRRGDERLTIAAGLARDSVDAARDTTRVVFTGTEDSSRVWERRAVQAEQRADDLDRALRRERVARAEVRVWAAALDTSVTLSAAGGDTVIRRAPYTLHIDHIEAPSATAADTGVGVGIHVGARVAGPCGGAPAGRIDVPTASV